MLLLHGTASHAHLWERFGPAFASDYHVIALDQRGHGDSDWPPDYRDGYLPNVWVDDIDAIVDELQLAPVTLIGVSAGGNTAMHFTAEHPEKVARLVIVEMGPQAAAAGVTRVIDSIPAREEFESLDVAVNYLLRPGGRADPELGRSHALHAVRRREDGSFALKGDPALRRKDWRRPLRTHEDNWAAARRVARPTLVIRGSESKLLSPEVAERMAREMPDCSLVTIEGAGHAVPLHRPAEFESTVRAWLLVQEQPVHHPARR